MRKKTTTVEAAPPPAPAPVAAAAAPAAETTEDRLRARALDTVRSATLEAILAAKEPLRTADVAREVADRLDLGLSDEDLGGLATVVRMVLDSDPLFSTANRQWDLAMRMGRAEGDRRKPVERALIDFVDLLGHPTDAKPVSVLASAVYGRPADYYQAMFDRVAPSSDRFFRAARGKYGISRWLLEVTSDDADDVEFDNFTDTTALEALRGRVGKVKAGDSADYARAVVETAGEPVDNKALQYLVWAKFPDVEPSELFEELLADSGLVLERGPSWATPEDHQRVLEEIRILARDPEAASDLVAASAPGEDEEMGMLAPTTVRVSDEDLEQVYHFMAQAERTYKTVELCQQALEAFPGSRTYQAVHDSLLTRMKEDRRFRWVGWERFRLDGTVPREVEVLPEGLNFDAREYLGEDEQEVDRIIDPRDWKFNLDEQILHYLVQDVGDDETTPGHAPQQLVSSPPLHHYVAGTRYLRNSDRGFFPLEPDLVQVSLVTGADQRSEVWVNNRLGLILGLKEWYDANLPWVGGQFTIERGEQPDEFRLNYGGETDPLMDIPLERLQQLLQLRAEAAEESLPLTEIVTRILKAHPDGIHFVTLFTEVNVVRRVRRARVASVLSGQRAFQQNPPQPGIWFFDEKRAAKAKKKGPKRPMREYNEDDDDFIEE